MKAAVIYQNGSPDVLKYEDVADPACDQHGIVIRVAAISVEGGDLLQRLRGPVITSPHVIGYQAAGEIVAVGAQVTQFKCGQRVVTVNPYGSHAELRAVPARNAWLVPEGLDIRQAAAIPVAFGTADECLFHRGHLKAGETVLIQAGASAVGIAAIQLAKRAGATVIATASSDERLARVAPFGLDHGINYSRENVVAAIQALTANRGVDLVVDPVGGATLQDSIRSLGYGGRLSMVGFASREPAKVDVASLLRGNRSLSGIFLAPELGTDRVHDNIQRLIAEVSTGALQVALDRSFPLAQCGAAHAYIESRQAVGRVLLIP